MGSESTSNSMKFPPLRLAELLPNLMALKNPAESPDTSYSSGEDSGCSPPPASPRAGADQHPATVSTRTPASACTHSSGTPVALCENSHNNCAENKENNPFVSDQRNFPKMGKFPKKPDEENASSSRTYPGRGCGDESCPTLSHHPSSEVKRRNVLSVRNNIVPRSVQSAQKRTPEYGRGVAIAPSTKSSTPSVKPMKAPISVSNTFKATPAVKSSTPVLKPGIKRFTPGSGHSARRSNKKNTPLKKISSPGRESARCLFPEIHFKPPETSGPTPAVPETPRDRRAAPETPRDRRAAPGAGAAATPSYPHTGQSSKITLKSIVIKGKSYMFIKKLGSGGSSEVFKVLEVGGECGEYAVKCVNMAVERNLAQGYINEIRLLRELQSSDRVIQLYAYEYDKASQSLKVVLEVGETDLSSFLKARQATGLPPALVLYYWEEMLHAVNHIHQHGVVHADLKPANFLLVCGRLKLIDFGIASAISTDATSVERPCAAGTFSYISPEALMGGAGRYDAAIGHKDENAPIKISFKSDVWSLGCILYSMAYGYTPFGHITHFYGKIAAIVDPKHVINYPAADNMPLNLMAALKWCLTYNAKSRPSVEQLLNIEYLSTARQHLPLELLNKIEPHVTPDEFATLRKAKI